MHKICPSQPHEAFLLLLQSTTFEAEWCPDYSRDRLAKTPVFRGMIDTFHGLTSNAERFNLLSHVAPYFKQHDVCVMFNC